MYRASLLIAIACMLPAGSLLAQAEQPSPVSTWVSQSNSRWVFRDPGNPLSARATAALTGPDYRVFDHDAAVLDLAKDMALELPSPMQLVPVTAWKRLNGADLRAGIADTSIGSEPAIVFMTVKQSKNSDTFELYAVAMQRETFVAWGGIVWLMADAGLIPDPSVFPPARQQQIAKAPYPQQLALFTKAADFKVDVLAKQLNEQASRLALMNQMVDLNLDLMFGELAVSPIAE